MQGEPSGGETFDLSVFEQLKEDLGEEVIGELVNLYLDHTSGLVAKIQELVAAGDYVELGKVAHGIKGASGNLGVVAVEKAARDLEECCKSDDPSGAPPLAANVAETFNRAKGVLAPYGQG